MIRRFHFLIQQQDQQHHYYYNFLYCCSYKKYKVIVAVVVLMVQQLLFLLSSNHPTTTVLAKTFLPNRQLLSNNIVLRRRTNNPWYKSSTTNNNKYRVINNQSILGGISSRYCCLGPTIASRSFCISSSTQSSSSSSSLRVAFLATTQRSLRKPAAVVWNNLFHHHRRSKQIANPTTTLSLLASSQSQKLQHSVGRRVITTGSTEINMTTEADHHNKNKNNNHDDGTTTTTTTTIADAKAYNEYASVAVDLSDPYIRNGFFYVTRSVRDIDNNVRRKYLYTIPLASSNNNNNNNDIPLPPQEMNDKTIAFRIVSASGKRTIIVRNEKDHDPSKKIYQQAIEVWIGSSLQRRILVGTSNPKHGNIVHNPGGSAFGTIPTVNSDGTILVYTAERHIPETKSFFFDTTAAPPAVKGQGTSSSNGRGQQNVMDYGIQQTWGEKLSSQAPLLDIYVVNLETGKIGEVINVPGGSTTEEGTTTTKTSNGGGYTFGQVTFHPTTNNYIVYTGWDAGGGTDMPRRLGRIYCMQRSSKIYLSSISNLLKQLACTTEVEKLSTESNNDDTVATDDTTTNTDPKYITLTPDYRIATSPIFTPAGTTLLFLSTGTKQNDGFDTHSGCYALHGFDCTIELEDLIIDRNSHKVVVDQIWNPYIDSEGIANGTVASLPFPGLFVSELSKNIFLPDNETILVTTQWGSTQRIIRINIMTGTVNLVSLLRETKNNPSVSEELLCISPDGSNIIVSTKSANQPSSSIYQVPISAITSDDNEATSTLVATLGPIAASRFSPIPSELLDSTISSLFTVELITTTPPSVDGVEFNEPIQSLLLVPTKSVAEGRKPKLLVILHGGPHSVSSSIYLPGYAYLCGYGGYALLMVNYRGSTGFGQGSIESLPTRIGTLDVLDIVTVTQQMKDSGRFDPDNIGVCGGSHGGFLTAHLTGQYPSLFQAAVVRNPVTNLASMVTATDIPDWIYVEGGIPGTRYDWTTYRPPTKGEVETFYDASPIRYISNVTTPTLVAIGMKDLRVPPSQGLEWYYSLKSKNVASKLLVYPNDDHALDSVTTEADHWIHIKQWFDQYLEEPKIEKI